MTLELVGANSGKGGPSWRKIRAASDGFTVADFAASHWGDAFITIGAVPVTNLTIGPGALDDVYRGLNMAYATGSLDGFHLAGLTATNLERGLMRVQNARNGLVEDCTADTGGRTCADIPVGFSISNGPAGNITFSRCTASGFVQNVVAGKYVNGDGFSTEEENDAITYRDCRATDNGDGGFDMKASNLTMTGCYAARNHRNFRLWGSGQLTDCVSEDPTESHYWFGGNATPSSYTLVRPVCVGGSDKPHIRIDAAQVGDRFVIVDPVVPAGETLRIVANDTGALATVEVVITPRAPLTVNVTGGVAVSASAEVQIDAS